MAKLLQRDFDQFRGDPCTFTLGDKRDSPNVKMMLGAQVHDIIVTSSTADYDA